MIEQYLRAWDIAERVARQMGWPLGEVLGYCGPRFYDAELDVCRRNRISHEDPSGALEVYEELAQRGDLVWAFWENRPPGGWLSDEDAARRCCILVSDLVIAGQTSILFVDHGLEVRLLMLDSASSPHMSAEFGKPSRYDTQLAGSSLCIWATLERCCAYASTRALARSIDAVTDGAISHLFAEQCVVSSVECARDRLYNHWFGREGEVLP